MMIKTQGLSLIEVLVALFILAIGLISLARLEITSFLHIENNYLTDLAFTQIDAMTNRLVANPQGLIAEVKRWNKTHAHLFPEGKCSISGTDPYEISISWYDKMLQRRITLKHKVFV